MREPAYPKRINASQIDPYKDQLVNWLRTDSHRPKKDRRTAKVLFQLIQAQGCPGGYAQVAICAKQWWEAGGAAPSRHAFITLRFAPGEAFQFDWSCKYAIAPVPQELMIDNDAAGTSSTGSWQSKNGGGSYKVSYRLSNNNGNTYRWTPASLNANPYQVYGWWKANNQQNSSARFSNSHSGQISTTSVDQTTNGGSGY